MDVSSVDGPRFSHLTTPMRFATGTPMLVSMTRLFSSAMLLLYQTSRMTLGALVPQVIMKHAK